MDQNEEGEKDVRGEKSTKLMEKNSSENLPFKHMALWVRKINGTFSHSA